MATIYKETKEVGRRVLLTSPSGDNAVARLERISKVMGWDYIIDGQSIVINYPDKTSARYVIEK